MTLRQDIKNIRREHVFAGMDDNANLHDFQSCLTCRFWTQESWDMGIDRQEGHCRRYPPTQNQLKLVAQVAFQHTEDAPYSEDDVHAAHPETSQEDWCGEYRPYDKKCRDMVWDTYFGKPFHA